MEVGRREVLLMLGVVAGAAAVYTRTNSYAANSPLLEYTDCIAPSYVNGWARFRRPISDAGNFEYCMPGARLRFRSDAKIVNILLRYNGLCERTDARNLIGAIYIDGTYSADFTPPVAVNVVSQHRLNIVNGSAADRLYEIVLPLGDSVEFGAVEVDSPYVVTAATPRSGSVMVCYGDSITQGFSATDTRRSWPYLLAGAKGFRCINMGYGGRSTVANDGAIIAGLGADLITVLMGYNDFAGQIALATFKATYKSLLVNIHDTNPNIPVYVITPITSTTSLTIPLSSYRTQITAAISELGYSQITSVDGTTLISSGNLIGGIHPNDTGAAQIATALGALIT